MGIYVKCFALCFVLLFGGLGNTSASDEMERPSDLHLLASFSHLTARPDIKPFSANPCWRYAYFSVFSGFNLDPGSVAIQVFEQATNCDFDPYLVWLESQIPKQLETDSTQPFLKPYSDLVFEIGLRAQLALKAEFEGNFSRASEIWLELATNWTSDFHHISNAIDHAKTIEQKQKILETVSRQSDAWKKKSRYRYEAEAKRVFIAEALLNSQLGNHATALAQFEHILEISSWDRDFQHPSHAQGLYYFNIVLRAAGNTEIANLALKHATLKLSDFSAATLDRGAMEVSANLLIGYAMFESGFPEEGAKNLKRALDYLVALSNDKYGAGRQLLFPSDSELFERIKNDADQMLNLERLSTLR